MTCRKTDNGELALANSSGQPFRTRNCTENVSTLLDQQAAEVDCCRSAAQQQS